MARKTLLSGHAKNGAETIRAIRQIRVVPFCISCMHVLYACLARVHVCLVNMSCMHALCSAAGDVSPKKKQKSTEDPTSMHVSCIHVLDECMYVLLTCLVCMHCAQRRLQREVHQGKRGLRTKSEIDCLLSRLC